MNIKNIKSQLKKIKRAVDLLQNDKKISALELDLLRDYIKTLYEYTLEEVEPEVAKKVEKREPRTHTVQAPKAEKAPEPVVAVKPAATKHVEEVKEAPKVEEKQERKVDAPVSAAEVKGDIKSLFVKQQASDLSEKLSTLAVEDLKKAMSINEKIFTINELFDGNSQSFNECLEVLDEFDAYDKAESYLINNIASRFDWTSKDKKKKAMKFIDIIRT
jgi:hypothetical protein